jgi:hypothetical protein
MLDNLLDLFERDRTSTSKGQPSGKKRSLMDRLNGLMDGEDDTPPKDRHQVHSDFDDRPDRHRQQQTKRDRFSDTLEFD